MAGWLDFYEDEVICPNCLHTFTALFVEDGNPKRIPIVITYPAQLIFNCPQCKHSFSFTNN